MGVDKFIYNLKTLSMEDGTQSSSVHRNKKEPPERRLFELKMIGNLF